MDSIPLVFIHYGPASYIRWALQAARRTNPEKRIILLGDESNACFARGIAEFFPFEKFAHGAIIQEFERVFQVIQGDRHRYTKEGGIETWLKFVFRRWFLINEFLKNQNINAFWIFDSDTLLLGNLALREPSFAAYEATTQCQGACLNGWVGSQQLVERYVLCINELFRDSKYIEQRREYVALHAGLAFNEMDAFSEFCRREKVQTIRAAQVIDGTAFDDALAFVEEYEPAPQKILGCTTLKRLWASKQGQIYVRRVSDGTMVRLLSCNMSWMPDFFWKRILKITDLRATQKAASLEKIEDLNDLKEIDITIPWSAKMKKRFFPGSYL